MTTDAFKITIHMVSSLDGMIAKKDTSVSWFETSDHYEKGVAGEDPEAFLKTIDCYVMGSRTYEHALELSKSYGWAYGDTPTLVITNRNLPVDRPNIEFFAGDLNKLVNDRLKPHYKNIWLVGGAGQRVHSFKTGRRNTVNGLADYVGGRHPVFESNGQEQALHLKDVIAYKTGMVELWYDIKKTKVW